MRTLTRLLLLGGLAACLPPSEPVDPEPRLLELVPSIDVGPFDALRIALDRAPLGLESARARVHDMASGAPVEARVTLEAAPPALVVAPADAWPPGRALELVVEGRWSTLGDAAAIPEQPFVFATRAPPAPEPTALRLLAPRPGTSPVANLRWIAVELVGAITPERIELRDEDGEAVELRLESTQERSWRLALTPRVEGCAPLCPGRSYRLTAVDAAGAPLAPPVELGTATVADAVPPRLGQLQIAEGPGPLRVELAASEPVLWRGTFEDEGGRRFALAAPLVPTQEAVLSATEPLPGDAPLRLRLELEDLAGHRAPPIEQPVRTPPDVDLRLSELVPTPIRDWSDSAPAGEPYDDQPGGGAVTEVDEWIELVNLSDGPVDAERLAVTIRVLDETPSETRVAAARAVRFGGGGELRAWRPGEALVVRPYGAMAQRPLVVELYVAGRRVDRVELGERGADHPGGRPPDFEHEAIARDVAGRWRWCRPTPGDPRAATDCVP
jgi:hypothetical protein